MLATGPLGDDRAGSWRLILDTARYLLEGDFQTCRAVSEQLVDRWRRALGPDHPTTLAAAATLAAALVRLREATPARVLGEDTVAKCRRVVGSDHPATLFLAQVAGVSHSSTFGPPADPGYRFPRPPPRPHLILLAGGHPVVPHRHLYC